MSHRYKSLQFTSTTPAFLQKLTQQHETSVAEERADRRTVRQKELGLATTEEELLNEEKPVIVTAEGDEVREEKVLDSADQPREETAPQAVSFGTKKNHKKRTLPIADAATEGNKEPVEKDAKVETRKKQKKPKKAASSTSTLSFADDV